MSWFSIFAVYFITWWVVFYISLPFGNRQTVELSEEVDGVDPGAPKDSQLMTKMLVTSVITAVLVFIYYYFDLAAYLDFSA